jgi:hypothetical protein
MSHLTSETREVWVPVFYEHRGYEDLLIDEGSEHAREEDAVTEAHAGVAKLVDVHGGYFYAKIEHRILPTYK